MTLDFSDLDFAEKVKKWEKGEEGDQRLRKLRSEQSQRIQKRKVESKFSSREQNAARDREKEKRKRERKRKSVFVEMAGKVGIMGGSGWKTPAKRMIAPELRTSKA